MGPRAVYLLGELAELEQSLIRFATASLAEKGYSAIAGPEIFRTVVVVCLRDVLSCCVVSLLCYSAVVFCSVVVFFCCVIVYSLVFFCCVIVLFACCVLLV